MEPFDKSLLAIMKEILARPEKFVLERNFYNEKTISVIVYTAKEGVELTLKSDGTIIMVFDEELAKSKPFNKPPKAYSQNNPEKKTLSHTFYGHTELEDFIHDFRLF